jgi:hypothetical protein
MLRDLKHHRLRIGQFEQLERSEAMERLERWNSLRF